MSWDAYVTNIIANACEKNCEGHPDNSQPHCDTAILLGLNGGIWCTQGGSGVLKIDPNEAMKIANAINTDNESEFQQNGVFVGGVKYRYLRKTDDIFIAKCKDQGMLSMKKTKQAIIIGHTIEGKSVGKVNDAVIKVCEYLESVGY